MADEKSESPVSGQVLEIETRIARAKDNALTMINEQMNSSNKAVCDAKNRAIEAIDSKKRELIDAAKCVRKWLISSTILVLLGVGVLPIVSYWTFFRWATQFDAVWARVVIFCVPQVILGLVCIVAIIAHAREDR
jgi:hypothetical protein